MKRIALKKEPVLKLADWIVVHQKLGSSKKTFHHFMTRKEVRAFKKRAAKGCRLEIHRSSHNFVEAWVK